MCGISGICNFEKKPSIEIVKLMASRLTHRGPDDTGYFDNEHVSFGHKRLSIIDLEKSTQPMKDSTNNNVIIFNGEIYNFKKLRKELEHLGHQFKTNGDTEVILKSYAEWGEDFLNKLEGMFAFCIWDEKEKKILLARDKFGEKPLFYYFSDKIGFLFSSEIKSFLAVKEIKDELNFDHSSFNEYLTLNYLVNNKTFFKNLFSLPPASYISIDLKKYKKDPEVIQYWFIENYFKDKTKDTFEDSSQKLKNLIKDSVNQRMFSDVDNGTFLSGGIDSSTISLQLKEIDNHKMTAHNIFFKETDFNEYKDAKIVSDYLKIKLDYYEIPQGKNLVHDFPSLIDAMDQPMSDTSFIATYYLSKYSSAKSKVVLSGDGGDELFCGYDTYIADIYRKFFPKINLRSRFIKKIISKLFKTKFTKVGVDYKITKFLNALSHNNNYSHILWREIFSINERINIFNKYDHKFINYDFLNFIDKELKKLPDVNYLDQYMYMDLKTWFPNDILYKIDRSTMYSSQESRLPFLDSKIVEYVCSLPINYKIKFFERKRILKSIVKNKLPKSLFQKKKSGFGTPVGLWLVFDKDFKEMAYDLLNTQFMKNLFCIKEINRIWDSHQNMEEDQTYKIFNLICLSQWIINNKLENKI